MDEASYGGKIFYLQMEGGQIRNQFKWSHVVVKFRTDPNWAFGGQIAVEFTWVTESISGSVVALAMFISRVNVVLSCPAVHLYTFPGWPPESIISTISR